MIFFRKKSQVKWKAVFPYFDLDKRSGLKFVAESAGEALVIHTDQEAFEDSLIGWIENYQDRLPESLYPEFFRSLGEFFQKVKGMPKLTSATLKLLQEMPNYNRGFRANFVLSLAMSAEKENYQEILNLVSEDLMWNEFGDFLASFLHKFRKPEIRALMMDSLERGEFGYIVATVAAPWKMVEAIPAIEKVSSLDGEKNI